MSTATAARRKCGPGRPRALGDGEVAIALFQDPRGWGTRDGESSPFPAKGLVGSVPPLGARSLVAATRRVGVRQGRGLFPVARRLSEGLEPGTRTSGGHE